MHNFLERVARLHAEPLPGYRLPVFHPGKTNVTTFNTGMLRNNLHHILGIKIGFLQEKPQVLAIPIGLETKHFFNIKIFRLFPERCLRSIKIKRSRQYR